MPRPRSAFTLVEITLAMGIASFALLVVFSTMPTGMASLQDTGRQIVETEIFNKIGSELATTPWAALPPDDGSLTGDPATYKGLFPRYFDVEGNELLKPAGSAQLSTADKGRKIYTVMFTVPAAASLWSSPTVPGNGDLRWGQVKVYYQFDPNSGTLPAGVKPDTHTFLLSNNGS